MVFSQNLSSMVPIEDAPRGYGPQKTLCNRFIRWRSSVQKALTKRLAKFKLPKRAIFADELPRNAMGKVQKNLLRETFGGLFVS
jgi:acyl-coenzyme A synthetase/AMP-(fatty) acid ligase